MAVRTKKSQLGEFSLLPRLKGVDGLNVVDINDAVARRTVCFGEIETTCFAFQAALLLQRVFLLGLN